jgi:hypothetical protein
MVAAGLICLATTLRLARQIDWSRSDLDALFVFGSPFAAVFAAFLIVVGELGSPAKFSLRILTFVALGGVLALIPGLVVGFAAAYSQKLGVFTILEGALITGTPGMAMGLLWAVTGKGWKRPGGLLAADSPPAN